MSAGRGRGVSSDDRCLLDAMWLRGGDGAWGLSRVRRDGSFYYLDMSDAGDRPEDTFGFAERTLTGPRTPRPLLRSRPGGLAPWPASDVPVRSSFGVVGVFSVIDGARAPRDDSMR